MQSTSASMNETQSIKLAGLSGRALWIPLVAGPVLWLVAALAVAMARAAGLMDGAALVGVYLAAIPGCIIPVLLVARIAGLKQGQATPAIALGTTAAAALDGLALVWGNGLYGGAGPGHAEGAALILWGVAWFLGTALWLDRNAA